MSSAGIHLRDFCFPQDYASIIDLWRRAGPGIHLGRSDSLEEIEKKLQRDPDLFILAELDGRLVGTVLGGYDGRRGLMYHLAVDPSTRQQGIGRILTNELEKRLQAKGCIKCYLLLVPGNETAKQFYEDHGWESMDVSIYGKELPGAVGSLPE
jgi:ribosomal protein S18 acetylase RimI-like enzyme